MKIFVASGAYLKGGVFILGIGLQQWDLPGFPRESEMDWVCCVLYDFWFMLYYDGIWIHLLMIWEAKINQ